MKNSFYRKYKITLKPIGIIVVAIILSLIAGSFFWGKIQETRRKIIANEGQNNILDDRLSTLESLIIEAKESSLILQYTLPQSNPSVLVLTHLNKLSSTHSVRLDGLSINKGSSKLESGEIQSVNLNFDIFGQYNDVYAFVEDLSRVSPLVNLESIKVEIDRSEGIEASIRLSSFYASLPDKLPPITSPLDDFTDEEKSTIKFLQTFAQPEFPLRDAPTEEGGQVGKDNPFEDILSI